MNEFEAWEVACKIGDNVRVGGDPHLNTFFLVIGGKRIEMSHQYLRECDDPLKFEVVLRGKLADQKVARAPQSP